MTPRFGTRIGSYHIQNRVLLWDGSKEKVSKMTTPAELVQGEFESRRYCV